MPKRHKNVSLTPLKMAVSHLSYRFQHAIRHFSKLQMYTFQKIDDSKSPLFDTEIRNFGLWLKDYIIAMMVILKD